MTALGRSHRMEKVDAQLLRLLSELLVEEYDAGNDLVTLTAVHTTPDLHNARITVTASANLGSHIIALNRQRWALQRSLKPFLDFKTIPNLFFQADTTGDAIDRVEHLLDQIESQSS